MSSKEILAVRRADEVGTGDAHPVRTTSKRRGTDTLIALGYQFDAGRKAARFDAMVVSDEDGVCLASLGYRDSCDEMAACRTSAARPLPSTACSWTRGAGRRTASSGAVGIPKPAGRGATGGPFTDRLLVKQRLCGAGMKWGARGAAIILSLRALNYTSGRWDQFWSKIDRYGFPVTA